MRVAYLITRSDNIGGAHVHVRDLASELLAAGHEVTVLVGGEGPYVAELAARRIPYYPLRHLCRSINLWHDLAALAEIVVALSRLRPDILSTHSSKAGWLGRVAGWTLGIPTVFTAHGWAFTEGPAAAERRFYALAERLAAPLASKIVTVSEYDREIALRYKIAPPEKLLTIHNGMPEIPEALRAKPAVSPPRLLSVARFERQKDHETLLKALSELRETPWTADLVGDGPLRSECQTLAERLGIADRVRFLGARNDVAELMGESQVFLLISNWEGLPRSIIEAMRAGLPVVASNVGGVGEEIVNGGTGFLVPRGGVTEVRESIARLITNPPLRENFGRQGRLRYEEGFTFSQMLASTMAVYRELGSRRRDR